MPTLNPFGKIAGAYYQDNSRIAVIMGPVGSAKTKASCLRVARHVYEQRPDEDGVRRSRWAIVRNTGPMLKDTTIKSWLELFPEHQYGRLVGNPPTQKWNFTPKGSKNPIEAEFMFRALDDAGDVKNLLSLEVDGFYFNEVSEIEPAILRQAGRRAGRAGGGGKTWKGWIGDTNPWDVESWLHDRLVLNLKPGWAFFKQPGGMEPDAENLENLEQTEATLKLPWNDPRRREQGRTYYLNALADYTSYEADRYVHCKPGASRAGKPVYVAYNDSEHCKPIALADATVLEIGYDCSGRNPAAVIGYHTAEGAWRFLREFCGEDIGMREHAERLKRYLLTQFPGLGQTVTDGKYVKPDAQTRAVRIAKITCDPAGMAKDSGELDMLQIIRAVFPGVPVVRAITNDPRTRIAAVESVMRRNVNGQPAFLIDPACKILRQACISKYHYRKLKLGGVEQYSDEPNKTHPYSDIADALQYVLLGGGEGRAALGAPQTEFDKGDPAVQKREWDVFAA